ncbi:MAG: glycosyltransferase family 8 protein [Rickettsiales bacterium]|jgi:lipopolysaccharide biosynthesis glycosyltransferase|nr:glycosyltransferase family 8 protein [Rickettsiales bacterium]
MITKENIHIALTCDNAYAHYCAETMVSILLNTKNRGVFYNFHIIQKNLREESRRRIAKLKDTVKDCKIEFLDVGPGEDAVFRDPMCYRLRMASLLPNLDKVIYTDCDVTFLSSPEDLWRENIDDYYTGNCIDWSKDKEKIREHFSRDCKVSENDYPFGDHEIYFNSGLMLMNLAKIRENSIEKKSLECMAKYPELKFKDQDVINLVYYQGIKPISFRWSFLISYYTTRKNRIKIKDSGLLADLRDSAAHPRMMHFVADKKPANIYRSIFHIPSYRIVNRYKKMFWNYLAYTDWKDEKTHKIIYKFPLGFLNHWN